MSVYKTECELAVPVKAYIRSARKETDIHEEVHARLHGEKVRFDIVGVQAGGDLISVETDLQGLTPKVVKQAIKRRKYADFAYVAIPTPGSRVIEGTSYRTRLKILQSKGIGLLHVDDEGRVSRIFPPMRNRGTAKELLEPFLMSGQRRGHVPAGSPGSASWDKFQEQWEATRRLLAREHPRRVPLKELALEMANWRWRSPDEARREFAKVAPRIMGINIRDEAGRTYSIDDELVDEYREGAP